MSSKTLANLCNICQVIKLLAIQQREKKEFANAKEIHMNRPLFLHRPRQMTCVYDLPI